MHPFENIEGLWLNGTFLTRSEIIAFHNRAEDHDFRSEVLAFAAQLLADGTEITATTSGSTGQPKMLKFPKTAVWQSAAATNEYFRLDAESRALLALPMTYIAGKMMVARALAGGYELIAVEPSSNPLDGLPEQSRIDFAPFTPHQAEVMARENPEKLSAIGILLLGGGATNTALRENLLGIGCRVHIGFGMAETLSHFALARISTGKEPVYEPLPGVTIGTDARGRLCVERPGILAKRITTRDIVEMTDTGFRFLGRSANVIVSGGINIYPEPIEQKIAHLMQGDFFVAGTPHPVMEQLVTLFTTHPDDAVQDLKTARLRRFERPKKTVLLPEFLYTTSGKIKRRETVEKWLAGRF